MVSHIFISYARKDAFFVERLRANLERQKIAAASYRFNLNPNGRFYSYGFRLMMSAIAPLQL